MNGKGERDRIDMEGKGHAMRVGLSACPCRCMSEHIRPNACLAMLTHLHIKHHHAKSSVLASRALRLEITGGDMNAKTTNWCELRRVLQIHCDRRPGPRAGYSWVPSHLRPASPPYRNVIPYHLFIELSLCCLNSPFELNMERT